MNQQRSTVSTVNLQALLDAEANPANLLMSGAAQYLTPQVLADYCFRQLPERYPDSAIDPQCGEGSLLRSCSQSYCCSTYGCDIDNRIADEAANKFGGMAAKVIIGNCMRLFEAFDDLYPDTVWSCGVANPPFGKRWKTPDGGVVDSTEATWKWLLKHCRYGYMIASETTLQKLGIDKHPWVYKHETRPASEFWDGVSITIGIVWWQNPELENGDQTSTNELSSRFTKVKAVMDEERSARPEWNIYLDNRGYLKTYLSTRDEIKLNLSNKDKLRLYRVGGTHPLALTTEKETRVLLRELVDKGIYTIDPAALEAIKNALAEVNALACPTMPVTDFESVAYADEEDTLECVSTHSDGKMQFTAGKKYSISTGSYRFTQKFKRTKVHFNEQTFQTYQVEHEFQISGNDRYIQVQDDRHHAVRFMDRPSDNGIDFDERLLWNIFKKPEVKTVAETCPDLIKQNLAVLRSCEMVAGFEYYPGQLPYLARVAAKDHGLIAASTGAGKSLMAISLIAAKAPNRALIIAPQGTMRSSDDDDDEGSEESMNASQWIQEIQRFAPYLQVWELFSYEDYERICAQNGGELPPGVYVSYYEAMFINKARETAPASWDDEKLNKWATANGYAELPKPEDDEEDKRFWCDSIGHEENGIRCIIAPCLATLVGRQFDFIALDEAHRAVNLDAVTTQMVLRLQPKYRYAFTATPIPDIVSNLFSLMGWLNVPGWYKGGVRNAAWPYAREDIGKFNSTFLSTERDFTEEQRRQAADPKWKGTCTKPSPIISSPARLLKLLKPSLAFISKEACNPNYRPPKIVDVRVPLGREQSALYAYYLDRSRIPASHPLVRARKQVAWLRAICADPAGFRHGSGVAPRVASNMNPKVIAILELVRDILAQGEQVVIINARIGLTDTIQHKLAGAGIPMARIDSTISADQHAYQANLFKSGKARIMLMGLRCAASYSFQCCKYEIIGSIDYSPGPFDQGKGRVDRVNSRPGVTIYCILHKGSIEEAQFQAVATKDDAASLCLRGKRVPRDYRPVDGNEVLAAALNRFDTTGSTPETDCEAKWPELRKSIASAFRSNSIASIA